MKELFPQSDQWSEKNESIKNTEWLKSFISSIRKIRSEMNIPPKKLLSILICDATQKDMDRLELLNTFITEMASIESINHIKKSDDAPKSATDSETDIPSDPSEPGSPFSGPTSK